MSIILLLWALLQSHDPYLTAYWTSSSSAIVSWTQQQQGCIYHVDQFGHQAFVGCYDGTGQVYVDFGTVGPLDGALRPRAGDSYLAIVDGQTQSAPLRGRVLLPMMSA